MLAQDTSRAAAKASRLIRGPYTRDAQALLYKMGTGFAGDVNRTHPFSVENVTPDPTNPPTYFGQATVIDATSHKLRTVLAGDTSLTDIYGITVRPFPFQQQDSTGIGNGAASIGNATPSPLFQIDVLRWGLIMVQLNNFAAAPCVKGGPVYVWIAATTTNHVQGGFEAQASSGNTIELPAAVVWNSIPDNAGVAELNFFS